MLKKLNKYQRKEKKLNKAMWYQVCKWQTYVKAERSLLKQTGRQIHKTGNDQAMNKQDIKTNIDKVKSKNKNRIKGLIKSDTRSWEFTSQRYCENISPYTVQCDCEEVHEIKTQVTERWGVFWGLESTEATFGGCCESWEMESGVWSVGRCRRDWYQQKKRLKKEQKHWQKENKTTPNHTVNKNRKHKKLKKRRKKNPKWKVTSQQEKKVLWSVSRSDVKMVVCDMK